MPDVIRWRTTGDKVTVHHLARINWKRTRCGKPIRSFWVQGDGGLPLCAVCANSQRAR